MKDSHPGITGLLEHFSQFLDIVLRVLGLLAAGGGASFQIKE
jgi:hypothetical protein